MAKTSYQFNLQQNNIKITIFASWVIVVPLQDIIFYISGIWCMFEV